MARAMQYYHCSLQAANLWTLEPVTEESIKAATPEFIMDYIESMVDDEDNDNE